MSDQRQEWVQKLIDRQNPGGAKRPLCRFSWVEQRERKTGVG